MGKKKSRASSARKHKKKKAPLKLGYKMKQVVLYKEFMPLFEILDEERRQIRDGKVKQIAMGLRKGQNFESPLVVNQINGKYRVIDGNHRVDAVGKEINRDPDFRMTCWMAVYKDLTRKQEREIYTLWNSGTPENSTDYLKNYFKTIPYGEEMLRRLNLSIYGSKEKMKVKLLVGSHIQAKRGGTFKGGYPNRGPKTVLDFCLIDRKDIATMKDFQVFYESVFEPYRQGKTYYRTTPFAALYRIWYDNRDLMDLSVMKDAFESTFKNKVGLKKMFEEYSKLGGISACKFFYEVAIQQLNDYRKKVHFVSAKELVEMQREEK